MKFLKKSLLSLAVFAAAMLALYPLAQAQSVLDDIKSKLESEGISVVDYSSPEQTFGSLPNEWVAAIKEDGFDSIQEIAEEYQEWFIGNESLEGFRRELAVLEAQKSRITQVRSSLDEGELEALCDENSSVAAQSIEEADIRIACLKKNIIETETEVKSRLASQIDVDLKTFAEALVLGKPDGDIQDFITGFEIRVTTSLDELAALETQLVDDELHNDQVRLGIIEGTLRTVSGTQSDLRTLQDSLEEGEKAVSILFSEMDFYFNYNKWGPIPLRVVGILEASYCFTYIESQDEGAVCSLQGIIDQYLLDSGDAADREDGLAALRTDLESLTRTIGGNTVRSLTDDEVGLIINATIIQSSGGEAQINEVGRAIANTIRNIAGALAALWIVIAGTRMIFAQGDENTITEQRRAILWGLIGLVAIILSGRLIDVLYGPAGQIRTSLVADQGFSNEIYGIVGFIEAVIGTIAMLFVVVSGVKMVAAQGQEDQITAQRKSIVWIGVGLILIAIDRIIVDNIFVIPTQQSDQITGGNIANIINTIGNVLQFLLGFVGLITLGILVYGSATMVMNFGNDEMVQKSKKIIRNAIIGVLIILSAYVIVASLVVFE